MTFCKCGGVITINTYCWAVGRPTLSQEKHSQESKMFVGGSWGARVRAWGSYPSPLAAPMVDSFGEDGFNGQPLSLTASLVEEPLSSVAVSLENGLDGFF